MVKNRSEKYLAYVDILGFKKLAEEEAEKTTLMTSEEVRNNFIKRVQNKIDALQVAEEIDRGEKQSPDSWLLFTDDLSKAFVGIHEILKTKLPFEIAIGREELEEHPTGDDLISLRYETMDVLKGNILNPYKNKYKEDHNEESIKETFILLTEDAFNELENFDRKFCKEISYTGKHFYSITKERIETKAKIRNFLEEIGHPNSEYYKNIDRVFVPPEGYDKIKKNLKDNRIAFIIGTAEYGKTYTSIRLLWEYFNEGYTPRWITGGSGGERDEVEGKLKEIGAELKPRHIIYFEDPFGKTKYESRDDLRRQIGIILNKIKETMGAYVIITSRNEVFEEFEREKLSEQELKDLKVELNMSIPSYGYEKRCKILSEWADIKGCKWLEDKELKNVVFDYIKDNGKLPTPLSIHNFAETSKNIIKKDVLCESIEINSRETKRVFADEIKKLHEDRILFLSFPFISEYLDINLIKDGYNALTKILDIKYSNNFDEILKSEHRVERYTFEIFGPCHTSTGLRESLKFVHQSYPETLPYALDEPKVNKIFSSVLVKLSEYPHRSARIGVAHSVANNFDKFPELARELILKLSKDEDIFVRQRVAYSVANNFDKFPELAKELLIQLSKEKSLVRIRVVKAVGGNFDKFPELSRELLTKLSKDKNSVVREGVVKAVDDNFDKFPELARELLLKLSKDEMVPVRIRIVNAVGGNFDKFPELAKELLIQLSKDEMVPVRIRVVDTVGKNFDKFPELSQELLLKSSEDEHLRERLVYALAYNFDKLPELAQKKLIELSKDENKYLRAGLVYALAYNFDKLPELAQKKLIELSKDENEYIRRSVARAFAYNFDKLPEFAQNILIELSKDENGGVRYEVAHAVATKSDKLPPKIQNLLDKLQKELESVIKKLSKSGGRNKKRKSLDLISNAKSKLRKEFVIEILTKLSSDKDGWVREKAISTLKELQ